ncbi:MAG TPA: hypothetical protein VFP37_00715 [Steroidobacteraceae bacterium]|nr:hypothetical protein [Steroidobacteraceae bacterium]
MLIVIGVAILVRRPFFLAVFAEYVDQRLVRVTMSMIELFAGIALVVAHNVWSPPPAAVLTIIGWMAVLEGTFFLLVPDGWLARFMATFSTPGWYVIGGLLAIVIGIYLAGFAFAWW